MKYRGHAEDGAEAVVLKLESGIYKKVKTVIRQTEDSQGHDLTHIRKSRPESGIHKTVPARIRHIQDSHGQILELPWTRGGRRGSGGLGARIP